MERREREREKERERGENTCIIGHTHLSVNKFVSNNFQPLIILQNNNHRDSTTMQFLFPPRAK